MKESYIKRMDGLKYRVRVGEEITERTAVILTLHKKSSGAEHREEIIG